MSTRLRWIFACAAVGIFAAVQAADPTAFAHDRKDRKHERHRKHQQHRQDTRVGKAPVRSYVELNRQIDELREELAALGQLPGEMSTLKLRVDSMSSQGSSVSSQWSPEMIRLRNEMANLGTAVGRLDQRVMALELDAGGSGSSLPALYDANEQKVGNVISLDQGGTTPWVAFNEGGEFFALKAISDHRNSVSRRLAGTIVRFDGPNCTGQAYLDPYDSKTLLTPPVAPFSLALAGVYDNNGSGPVIIYVAPARAASVTVKSQSMVDAEGFCVGSFNGAVSSVPAVMTLESKYVPPYTVR